jgi:hypothetical protein
VAPLAALVLAVSLTGCGGGHHEASPPVAATDSPGSTTPPAATTSPGATTPPVTAPGGTGPSTSDHGLYRWSRAASPALLIGGGASTTLSAVVAPSGRAPWTIAGTRLAAGGGSTATAWISPDGASWHADPLTGPRVDSQAQAATAWHQGTVIVGSVGPPTDRHAAVWIAAAAGAPFARASSPSLVTADSTMTLVTSGPLGLIGAGTAAGHIAMWYSADGRHWTRLTKAEQLIGAADDPHVDTLLATTNEGVFAAGWDHSGSSIEAALWSSGDGIHWRRVDSAQPEFGGRGDHIITGLAQLQSEPSVTGTALVAVGAAWTGSRWAPASWISPNGVSWSRPSTAFALGARIQPDATDAMVRAISAIPSAGLSSTLVAVGGGPTAQRIWKSTDGLRWAEQPLPAAAAASDQWEASLLAVAGSTTIIADADPGQPQVLVDRAPRGWLQPSADPRVFGAIQPVARPSGLMSTPAGVAMAVEIDDPGQIVGPGTSSTRLLTSTDGTNWAPMPTGGVFAGAKVTGLAPAPGGMVAVGLRQTGSTTTAVAWASPAGRSWDGASRLDGTSTVGSDGASAVCTNGGEVVAVGWARSASGAEAARVWASGDGVSWTEVPVSPPVRPGADAAMAGCSAAPAAGGGNRAGFDAFGTAASAESGVGAAFWSSAEGLSWTRQSNNPFGDLRYPALDVARTGAVWLAATATPDPDLTSAAPPAGSGLWVTTDAGDSWQQVDTSRSVWQGQLTAHPDRVAFLGSMPVVAGEVDGRLAVWVGVPK